MALGASISRKRHCGARRDGSKYVIAALALSSVSCVPVSMSEAPVTSVSAILVATAEPVPATAAASAAAPAARPAILPRQLGAGFVFGGRTALDSLRSLDCLAQAIYYEAASESEDGQRAVGQVVLNRVRHPAWPNSVCGVVYQGPMRAGGGCQFTFTCDGSLARRPSGPAWDQARRLAAEALAGKTYTPVGQSTHYHTRAVSPQWAPRLTWTTAIGAHIFYRLPGRGGETGAFTAAYAGSEPSARPAMTMMRRATAPVGLAALFAPPQSSPASPAAAALPSAAPQGAPAAAADLPESTVRDAYRNSGQWREDAPAAISGR